ncbi:hypothetical protein ACES2L_06030 [Bdellovibrio bacteriovorus]
MSSITEICNLALSHLGVGTPISNIQTEKTEEAQACGLNYEFALGFMLRTYHWPFFSKTINLALVEEDPTIEWGYSYRVPNDCARLVRLISGQTFDTPETRIKYVISHDDSGLLIYTNQPNAQAEYVINDPDPRFFPFDFTLALSYKLATLIAPRVTGGDVFKITERCNTLFDRHVSRALATSQNESNPYTNDESGFERCRR